MLEEVVVHVTSSARIDPNELAFSSILDHRFFYVLLVF